MIQLDVNEPSPFRNRSLELVPQAIFGRPIHFFTPRYRRSWDDLDYFDGASFDLDQDVTFSLRRYHGHPPRTVTLYLEDSIGDTREVIEFSYRIAGEFKMSSTGVRWKRGDPVNYGSVDPGDDRLREPEARILFLKIAAIQPKHEASTTFIKQRIPEFFDLTPADLRPSPTRHNEERWQQIVGNVISHHDTETSIFSQGYATRTAEGIRVTPRGLRYLESIGYSLTQGADL